MKHVQAAGGVVHRLMDGKQQVLLIYRRQKWDLPKGKKEPGETLKSCACREVAEETGIPPPEIEKFLCKTTHQYERGGHLYRKHTHWYVMQTEKRVEFTPQDSEGITAVSWVEIATALDIVAFANLRTVLMHYKNEAPHC